MGDLFDAVAEGSDAFSEAMRRHFEQAKRLYETKLQPLIELQHGARFVDVADGTVKPAKVQAMRGDDRLVKTLLLAALVPDVEALRSLTSARLAALNHGTIRTPIPGAEKQQVLAQVRTWAAQVGEVRISDSTDNPTLSIQLAGVDVESILERARHEDNTGNRRRKVRELLFEQFGIADVGRLYQTHEVSWRGTRRRAEIDYGNIRELGDERFCSRGETWRVIIDFPFDPETGHSPQDDVERVAQFRRENELARSLVWIPSFLSQSALQNLGALVILDHVLNGERFAGYASHMSLLDQQTARGLLDNRRAQLKQRVCMIIEGAYGAILPMDGTLSHQLDASQQFQSLDPACRLQPPVGVNLRDSLDHLLRQALDSQFPKHPDFGPETDIRTSTLKRVWTEVQAALQEENYRKRVDQSHRKVVRQVVYPLELCDVGDDVIVVKRTWQQHFDQYLGQGGGALTVKRLRGWTDQPEPRGLLPEVQNLLILAYADMTNRRFTLHGVPVTASIDVIDNLCELVEEPLPSQPHWEEARARAAALFGVNAPPLRNASTVGAMADQVQTLARQLRAPVAELSRALSSLYRRFGINGDVALRMRTLLSLGPLLESVERAAHVDAVSTLAQAHIATSASALGTAAKRAEEVVAALKEVNWQPVEALPDLVDERKIAANQLIGYLRQVLELDEIAQPLAVRVKEIERSATALHIKITPPHPDPPSLPVEPGWTIVDEGSRVGTTPKDAREALKLALKKAAGKKNTRVTITWKLEERAS